MKKIMVLCLIVALGLGAISGCANFKAAICSPTADRAAELTQQIAQATSVLAYYQDLAPTIPVQAIISGLQMAVALLSQARDGICVDTKALAAAQANVGQANTVAKALKAGKSLRLTN